MRGFYWLIEGALAGCSRPGHRHGAATSSIEAALDEDLGWLKGRGIEAVLSLTETPLTPGALERHDLAGLHLPVDDLTAPTPAQLGAALTFIDWHRALGQRVAVHCLVGQGRTGTVLAAYLIRDGLSPAEALRDLRTVCPGAVENPVQERALEEFAARRDWII